MTIIIVIAFIIYISIVIIITTTTTTTTTTIIIIIIIVHIIVSFSPQPFSLSSFLPLSLSLVLPATSHGSSFSHLLPRAGAKAHTSVYGWPTAADGWTIPLISPAWPGLAPRAYRGKKDPGHQHRSRSDQTFQPPGHHLYKQIWVCGHVDCTLRLSLWCPSVVNLPACLPL